MTRFFSALAPVLGNHVLSRLFVLILIGAAFSMPVRADFSLDAAKTMIVRGRAVDPKLNRGVSDVLVTVRTDYDEYRTNTDAEGDFTLEISAPREMDSFEIVFSHPDYREKYFHTAFDKAIRGSFEAKVEKGGMKLKHYKTKAELKCGEEVSVGTREGGPVLAQYRCSASHAFRLKLSDGNEISVTAQNPFQLKVEKERIEVRGVKDAVVTLDVTAMVYKR